MSDKENKSSNSKRIKEYRNFGTKRKPVKPPTRPEKKKD